MTKHIAVYVTGGIAAYKALEVVRALIKKNYQIQVVMTKNAQEFIKPLTFATLSQNPVLTDNYQAQSDNKDFIPHIKIARWADLAIVVPATADIIAKMAHGIADDLASTALMATTAQKIVFPAMNTSMWEYPATQNNIQLLKQFGMTVVSPAEGFLAEGEVGKGRLVDLDTIIEQVEHALSADQPLSGKKIIVTAGGTKEPIDPVRFIGNNSSGKMGIAMAESAASLGADVELLTTVQYRSQFSNLKVVAVSSAESMLEQLQVDFPKADVLVMAAAISDFKPVHVASQKIKKDDDQATYTIEFKKNPDILKTVAAEKTDQTVVGFAAETENLIANAEKKLLAKHADIILANDVSQKDAGFNVDTNRITLISKDHEPVDWPKMSKIAVADKFWQYYLDNLA